MSVRRAENRNQGPRNHPIREQRISPLAHLLPGVLRSLIRILLEHLLPLDLPMTWWAIVGFCNWNPGKWMPLDGTRQLVSAG